MPSRATIIAYTLAPLIWIAVIIAVIILLIEGYFEPLSTGYSVLCLAFVGPPAGAGLVIWCRPPPVVVPEPPELQSNAAV